MNPRFLLSLLLLLLFPLLTSPLVQAKSYAEREDVRVFIAEMQTRNGLDGEQLRLLFAHIKPIPAVIDLVKPPADPGVRSWRSYRSRFVEPKRIAAGRRFIQLHAKALAVAEARHGVPAEIIAAIIGVETIYGKHMGRFGTFATLTTLAFDYPPRAALFRTELEELLLLAREESRDPLSYTGSFAGALGLPQFLPSSRRKFAVDFDENGHIDLTASAEDAIGSVANFLAQHGWVRDAPIAVTVQLAADTPEEAIKALLAEGISPRRTAQEIETAGVKFTYVNPHVTGETTNPTQLAALIDLVTPANPTEYRLGYLNFWVITRYNRSSFYAAAVMDLATVLSRTGRL